MQPDQTATRDFKEILDNLPEKSPRSRLEPYRELILEMRRRGRPLREIAQVLGEKCGVRVVPSTIHDFVRAGSRSVIDPAKRQRVAGPKGDTERIQPSLRGEKGARPKEPLVEAVHQRIASLKLRPVPVEPSQSQFQYDPNEPLHVGKKRKVD
jgi:hypothetical protein